MPYYARSREDADTREYQLLTDHLTAVADLTAAYCSSFTIPEIGAVCGRLHDIGKYSDEFQQRIQGAKIRTDHSTAGAKTAWEIGKRHGGLSEPVYALLAYIIAGHHAGLPDKGHANADLSTLYQRLKNCDPARFAAWKQETAPEFPDLAGIFRCQNLTGSSREEAGLSLFLYTHFLFSCLIDADRTDAMQFDGQTTAYPAMPLEQMKHLLDARMDTFSHDGDLNRIRADILASCRTAAAADPGFFTLTVPTGGGKTLASLTFALDHAAVHGCSRIIYTIPFTSIIEQNAKVYADIFGEGNVLEHHANFVLPRSAAGAEGGPDDENRRLALAEANWDVPLVLTTNVQFFESLFSAHPSRARKVHNIAGSVIILDEVQALPSEFLRPCMYALAELVRNYHCTVVLCTATQPEFAANRVLPPGVRPTEIVPEFAALAQTMRRARAVYLGVQSVDAIADRLAGQDQVLCIVNTKRHARDLFARLREKEGTFHLSTNMCPAHRRSVIAEIRQRLRDGMVCRVVSTQLIEAGVDLDFPVVFRALAGVDAMVQAAGRCNREGKLSCGVVYVFVPEREYAGAGYVQQTAEIAAACGTEDFLAPKTVSAYFRQLFSIRDTRLDEKDILRMCGDGLLSNETEFAFASIGERFRLIADSGCAVIVPLDAQARQVLSAREYLPPGVFVRKISPFCVSVHRRELDMLYDAGLVQLEGESFAVLTDMGLYQRDTGLVVPAVMEQQEYVY